MTNLQNMIKMRSILIEKEVEEVEAEVEIKIRNIIKNIEKEVEEVQDPREGRIIAHINLIDLQEIGVEEIIPKKEDQKIDTQIKK